MNRETVIEEHFFISIEPSTVASAYLLIAQTGVLLSEDLKYRLAISDIQIDKAKSQKPYLFFRVETEIHDISGKDSSFVKSIAAVGSFSQSYHYLVAQFELFLIQKGLNILVFQEEKDA